MATVTKTLLLLVFATVLFSVANGFSIDLLHRDSPDSPMYNPTETRAQRLENAFKRSLRGAHHRLDRIKTAGLQDDAEAPLGSDTENAQYLVKISLGRPSFPIVAVADTGSDIIWTQCKPCPKCFKQIAPLFDPSKSATYRNVPCGSKICPTVVEGSSCKNDDICKYTVNYGDQSHSIGNLAIDTLTLNSTTGRPIALRNTIIGCGHDNGGTFSNTTSGILGLGAGPASLISQLGSSISGKFSYCLPPFGSKNPSKLSFGESAVVSGGIKTPLFSDRLNPTFYNLQLDAISVGSKRVEFPNLKERPTGRGNIIIDSGTSLTLVPDFVQADLAKAVAEQVRGGAPVKVDGLGPCYQEDGRLRLPTVTMHFQGADVVLPRLNTFVEPTEDVYCFAFVPTDSVAIYGNVAQQNFLVGYDVKGKTVTFKPTNCGGRK